MIYTEGPKNMKTPRSTFWRYLELTHKIIGCQQTKAPSLVRSLRSTSHNKVIPLWKVADYTMAFLCHKTSPIQYLLPSCFQNRINSIFSGLYLGNIQYHKNRITKTLLLESYHNIIFRKYNDWKRSYIVFVFATNE